MIRIRTLDGEAVTATAQIVGETVAVVAFFCPNPATADRLIGGFERRLKRMARRFAARTPVAAPEPEPVELFPFGTPVRVSAYAWDQGEMAYDATVLGRVSPTRLKVRSRMGRETEVDQRDCERGAARRPGRTIEPETYVRDNDEESLG